MFSALAFCTALIALATLLPLSRNQHWLVRGLDFPRLQIAIVAAVLVLADLALLDLRQGNTWVLIVMSTLCLAWQLWWITPYTRLWPHEVKAASGADPEREISFLTSNVLQPNRDANSLIALVRKHRPDVLVTLESDRWWGEQLAALEADMPHSIKCPLDNLYGMHVHSRLPLEEGSIRYLVEQGVPSIHASLVLRSGDKVRVHFLHPAPPSPTENPESGQRDAELVIVARSVAESKQPIVVAGDLNDVAWSATTRLFRKISGLLDPRVGRGMFNTFHASHLFMRWPLDHLFHSDHFTLASIQRLSSIGSDHFPLLTCLRLSPQRAQEQQGIEPDADDLAWTREIAAQQGASKRDVPQPNE